MSDQNLEAIHDEEKMEVEEIKKDTTEERVEDQSEVDQGEVLENIVTHDAGVKEEENVQDEVKEDLKSKYEEKELSESPKDGNSTEDDTETKCDEKPDDINEEMCLNENKDKVDDKELGNKSEQNESSIESNMTLETENVNQQCQPDEQSSTIFLAKLNLLPRKRPREEEVTEDSSIEKRHNGVESNSDNTEEKVCKNESSSPPPQPSLVQVFKKDSDRVVKLLSEALSMDSLSDLLKKEHRDSTEQLELLKEKLQKAQNILQQFTEQKNVLLEQIDQVTGDIQKKRSQLETTREDLKELGMQESSLKSKRDEAYTKCSDLRKKLHASREALQQIQKMYGKQKKGDKTIKEITAES